MGSPAAPLSFALAQRGRASILFERRPELAQEGSGNAAGVFHGVVHGHDGHHARFHRAAAYEARQWVADAIVEHGVRGSTSGLLRLASRGADVAPLHALLGRLGFPADYVSAVSAREAGAIAGVDVAAPAWHFAGGGWVEPRALAQACADRTGERLAVHCGHAVAALRRRQDRWQLLDAAGGLLATAEVVVLANAGAALDLLGGSGLALHPSRGQTSGVETMSWPTAGALRLPLAGSGYLLPSLDGTTWFGASSHEGDLDPDLRDDDHRANVGRLAGLVAVPPSIEALGELSGRVGWRWASPDRLPLIGPVPLAAIGAELGVELAVEDSPRPEQPRFAPRAPGLFVFAGLGSRGIAGSALGAQVLGACITGTPMPLEADLLDAIDPARFASRAFRRAGLLPGAAG